MGREARERRGKREEGRRKQEQGDGRGKMAESTEKMCGDVWRLVLDLFLDVSEDL